MNTTLLAIPAPRDVSSATTLVYQRPEQQAVIDARLLAILDAPLAARETPMQGFSRKERDLGNAFAQLTIEEAADMFERLATNFACDALARKFNKLAEERRARLLDFLDLLADPFRRTGLISAMQ